MSSYFESFLRLPLSWYSTFILVPCTSNWSSLLIFESPVLCDCFGCVFTNRILHKCEAVICVAAFLYCNIGDSSIILEQLSQLVLERLFIHLNQLIFTVPFKLVTNILCFWAPSASTSF
jgi:hypothetical protein